MTNPLVSVIIPTFNRRRMLNQAIESVVMQTIEDWELIVVNDASTDGTDELLRNWMKKDKRIRYERNDVLSGGSGARNIGIYKAKGEFIAFLDDDDMWLPAKLEKQLNLFKKNPEAVASSCWFTACYFWGKRIIRTACNPDLQQLLSDNILGSASVCMVRKSVIKEIGGFSENLPSAQDWDFWISLRIQGSIMTVCESLVNYSVHQESKISTDLTKKHIGFRRFFLKYRLLMLNETRRDILSTIAYIRSRSAGNLRMKFLWLIKSLRWSNSFAKKVSFIFSVLYHLKQ